MRDEIAGEPGELLFPVDLHAIQDPFELLAGLHVSGDGDVTREKRTAGVSQTEARHRKRGAADGGVHLVLPMRPEAQAVAAGQGVESDIGTTQFDGDHLALQAAEPFEGFRVQPEIVVEGGLQRGEQ